MRSIPLLLIYGRLLTAPLMVVLAFSSMEGKEYWLIALIAAGLISDIFDGIIARRLGISTEKMRRLDSFADQVFWIGVLVSAVIVAPGFFREHFVPITILLGLEAAAYIISYLRFGKEVATHAIASKFWTLLLFATLVQVVATGTSDTLFIFCITAGILTRLEIIGILFILRSWTSDVPSVYHAIRIRQNKPIKKHKLFNG